MALKFQPKPGSVVMCDFRTGFIVPEMVKYRPVVVIARHSSNSRLVTIVPLSTTAPAELKPYHHALSVNPLPDRKNIQCWAKCDMVMTVSLSRLDRYKTRVANVRQFVVPVLLKPDFEGIQHATAAALNLTGL